MMKKKYVTLPACFALLSLALGSCTQKETYDYELPEVVMGQLVLDSVQVNIKEDAATRALSLADYRVSIEEVLSGKEVHAYRYGSMPSIVSLPVGSYEVTVDSHEPAVVAFDTPYYAVKQEAVIKADEITSLGLLTCKLANIRVSVKFAEDLLPYLEEDVEVILQMGNSQETLSLEDSRSVYFLPQEETSDNVLIATLRGTVDGEWREEVATFTELSVGVHQCITFSVSTMERPAPEGDLAFNLQVDASMNVWEEDVLLGYNEGILDEDTNEPEGHYPTITGEGFDIDEVQLIAGETTIVVNMEANAGIANLYVEIDSETLTEDILEEVNLAKSFDLAYPGALEEGLKGLGFPVGDEVIGTTSVRFDITPFTTLLGIYGPGNHHFNIRIVDQSAPALEVTKTLKLRTI